MEIHFSCQRLCLSHLSLAFFIVRMTTKIFHSEKTARIEQEKKKYKFYFAQHNKQQKVANDHRNIKELY